MEMQTDMQADMQALAPIVNTTAEWRERLDQAVAKTGIRFFHIKAQLPRTGRTNQVLAASQQMNIVLKTYASGGENELHAHANEDHLFVILKGRAVFHSPRGHEVPVQTNDCVLIPSGQFYKFHVIEGEPLVMLRVGAVVDPQSDVLARIDTDGQPFDGHTEKNKQVACELHQDWWFE